MFYRLNLNKIQRWIIVFIKYSMYTIVIEMKKKKFRIMHYFEKKIVLIKSLR